MLLLCAEKIKSMEDSSKWFAVVNPHAGNGKTISEWKKAAGMLSERGIGYVFRETDCRMHATEIAYRAAVEGFRRFIAVGGDGTIHEVLGGIAGAIGDAMREGRELKLDEFYLAVLPVGSGNDWIRSHGIPHDASFVADLIHDGSFALQDIARVSVLRQGGDSAESFAGPSSYMVNIGGTGLDARVCRRVSMLREKGRKGRLMYINSLIYNLIHNRPSEVRVECDGVTVYEGECLSIAFGIGRYSGGGLRQTPEAVTDDGLLDYTIVFPVSLPAIFKDGYRLFNGTFTRAGITRCGRCRSISVYPLSGSKDPVEVDGEIVGEVPVRVEILPQQINVLHSPGRQHV